MAMGNDPPRLPGDGVDESCFRVVLGERRNSVSSIASCRTGSALTAISLVRIGTVDKAGMAGDRNGITAVSADASAPTSPEPVATDGIAAALGCT